MSKTKSSREMLVEALLDHYQDDQELLQFIASSTKKDLIYRLVYLLDWYRENQPVSKTA